MCAFIHRLGCLENFIRVYVHGEFDGIEAGSERESNIESAMDAGGWFFASVSKISRK